MVGLKIAWEDKMTHTIRPHRWLSALAVFFVSAAAFAATSWEYYQAGTRLYNRHEYSQAAKYFQAAVQEDPNNWQAYQMLGMSDYALGDREGAKQAFDQSLRIHPDNPQLAKFDEKLSSGASPGEHSPIVGGGQFGLGLDIGGPGDWGVTGKYWLDDKNAFQGAMKFDGGTILQFQYLWHDYDVIRPAQGDFPFYIGVGGDLAVGGGVAVGGCVPIGLTYLFQKKTLPLDIFVEAVPTLWISTGGASLQLYGDLGSRYYF